MKTVIVSEFFEKNKYPSPNASNFPSCLPPSQKENQSQWPERRQHFDGFGIPKLIGVHVFQSSNSLAPNRIRDRKLLLFLEVIAKLIPTFWLFPGWNCVVNFI
jgi:hypothetical protein